MPVSSRVESPRRAGSLLASGVVTAGVVALGIVRLQSHASMWRDEAWTALVIERSFSGVVGLVLRDEANMGPYYVALRVWSVFGSSDAWLRGFSVFAGIGAALALFHLVERHVDRLAAALAVVLFVANPEFVHHLTETRGYMWATFLVVVATDCLLRLLDGGGRRWIVGYGVAMGLAVGVHLLVVLVVAGQLLGVLLWSRPSGVTARRLLAGGLLALGVTAPFLPIAFIRRDANTSWVTALPSDRIIGALENAAGGRTWALLMLLGIVVVVLRAAWRRPAATVGDRGAVGILLLSGVLPGPMLVLLSLARPMFVGRYLVPALPFLATAAAIGYSRLLRPRLPTVLVVAGVTGFLFVTMSPSPFKIDLPEDLRAEAVFLAAHAKPSDGLVFYPGWARANVSRYWDFPKTMDVSVKARPEDTLFPTEYGTAALRLRLARHPRVWVVGYPGNTWRPRGPDPLEPLMAELRRRPTLESRAFGYFGGPVVTLYGPSSGRRSSSERDASRRRRLTRPAGTSRQGCAGWPEGGVPLRLPARRPAAHRPPRHPRPAPWQEVGTA